MDSMLGDSLLDPPQSLAKMAPRRYQSPSRCGSPSLEAPEPLMVSRGQPLPSYDQAMAMRGEAESPEARLNRHDLLRRRDLSQFHGLHPRLFQSQQRLSLPPKPAQPPASIPCRAVTPGHHQPPLLTSDTLPVRCTISGKHICQFEEEVVEHSLEQSLSPAAPTTARRSWGPRPRAGAPGWAALRPLTVETAQVTPALQIRGEDRRGVEVTRIWVRRRWRMCWPISRPGAPL